MPVVHHESLHVDGEVEVGVVGDAAPAEADHAGHEQVERVQEGQHPHQQPLVELLAQVCPQGKP